MKVEEAMRFWTDDGHLSKLGMKTAKRADKAIQNLFRLKMTPCEALELENVLIHAVQLRCTLKRLDIQCKVNR